MRTGESADAALAVEEARELPCLDVPGARITAGMHDGVLVVNVRPADAALPVVVKVDDLTVAGAELGLRPRGKHRRQ